MSKKNQNKNQANIVGAMKSSKGRFFGLTTKAGDVINAQFVNETPSTVVIYDRNRFLHRRLNKTSLQSFSMGSLQLG